jgi:predicted anti-sigma-YlaC factor YlaD
MKTCAEIDRLLSDYLNRDLPPDTCAVVQEHLDSCPRCGATSQGLQRTVDLCRQYRNENRPGPLAIDKHEELKEAFQRALSKLRND